MSSVHILTFHRALNYGAVLQCYGLYKTVLKIQNNCDVIDYRADCIEKRYRVIHKNNSLKGFVKAVLTVPNVRIKRRKFNNFIRNNIKTTATIKSQDNLSEISWSKSDFYCVGSDQVWNLDLIEGDTSFLLDFVPEGATKISYAASIGTRIKPEWKEIFANKLESFQSVSVREQTAQEQLEECGVKSSVEIDPVFLLTKEEWVEKAKSVKNESYILIYLLQKADDFMNEAIKYAKKKGKKIVIISTGLKRQYDAEYVSDCGPEEFLGYFNGADTVFTNSFHGIAFSILLNKNFYYQLQGNNVKTNSRLLDIIKMFNLEQRHIDNIEKDDFIDYKEVNGVIEEKRKSAIKYIEQQITG